MQHSRYVIHEGEPPSGYKSALNEPVYYSPAYLSIQQYDQLNTFLLLDTATSKIVAKALFSTESSGTKISLPRAPFGGICHTVDLDSQALKWWLSNLLQSKMVIKQPVYFYEGYSHILEEMNALGQTNDINHHIDLDGYHLGQLHNMQIRRIRKCKHARFEFKEVKGEEELAKVYVFIAECRMQQGLVINIPRDKFMQSFTLLADHYRAFIIATPEGETIAATVVIRVSNGIAYNYLPASSKQYHRYSPMAFLLFRTALLYKSEGYDILDLGITSIDGEEQVSLARFKERMGAIRSPKTTYYF